MEYFVYDIVRGFWTQITNLFFRKIDQGNAHSIPREGPVIFVVAPHNNQFVDPLILLKHSPRRVYFLIAASSMKKRIVGFYARILRAIPVERAMDNKVKGIGRIKLETRYEDPRKLTGIGTKFTQEFVVGDRISIEAGKFQTKVEEILSDTELLVSNEIKSLEVLEPLTSENGAKYDKVPPMDQHEMYKAVYERLNNGECIGIFPEGGSHDQSKLLPLKIGVCLMALGATVLNPDLKINIVPAGLNYFHPSKFRSRAVIEFGNPITVDPELVEMFKKGGEDKRKAAGTLLDIISEALKQVTLNTPDYETLKLIHTCRRLYNPGNHSISMRNQVELSRRFVKGYMQLKDNKEVASIIIKVHEYKKKLEYYGIRDHQVEKLHIHRFDALGLFLWRFLFLLVFGIAALPGALLNTPVFLVTRVVSRIKAKAALAASTVKLQATDVIATWKILVALVFVPTLYSFYSVIFAILSRKYSYYSILTNAPQTHFLLLFLEGIIITSFISYAALSFGEHAVDILKSLRPLYAVIINSDEASKELITERAELSKNITDLVNELGPQIYPNMLDGETELKNVLGKKKSVESGLRNRFETKEEKEGYELPSGRFAIPSITPGFVRKLSSVSSFDFLGTGTDQRRKRRKSRKGLKKLTSLGSATGKKIANVTSTGTEWLTWIFQRLNVFSFDLPGTNETGISSLSDVEYLESEVFLSGSPSYRNNSPGHEDEEDDDYYSESSTGGSSISHSRNSSFENLNNARNTNTFSGLSPLTPNEQTQKKKQ
ncbi:hypothetical protein BB559_003840 [Furculomyces boomerangus]|uniref:Phospholipid/glycerol acyltransferase domain-containing protein n=2 Tax=Harpellales TaxID=61421 RepID=A0A2T9YIH1_9FUNG|nr:hypothetical protein BB559_003840 [Furculomyces boomerangus]PWA00153.1 hypothetical protein BB558_003806 [Smittium angustum]